MDRRAEVWIDDGRGGRTRVWPPPWGADVPAGAAEDARKAFELLARSAQASREEAVRRAEREMAAAARWEQREEVRSREQFSRGDHRRNRFAPPLESVEWRRWTDGFGCVNTCISDMAAFKDRATAPAGFIGRRNRRGAVFLVCQLRGGQFEARVVCRRCTDPICRVPGLLVATDDARAARRRRRLAWLGCAAQLTRLRRTLRRHLGAFSALTDTQMR